MVLVAGVRGDLGGGTGVGGCGLGPAQEGRKAVSAFLVWAVALGECVWDKAASHGSGDTSGFGCGTHVRGGSSSSLVPVSRCVACGG